MLKVIISFSIAWILYSCQKESVSAGQGQTINDDPVVVHNVNKNTLLVLVNNVRKTGCNCGATSMPPVGTVTWNDQLSQAAYDHSRDMYSQNYFSHTSKTGSNPGIRITNAGYTWRTYGENIAYGYADEQAVVDGWLKSEGHCKNIMNANFREMGVGREGDYWTQEFGAR